MTPQLHISYFIFQRSHHRGLHRAANVGLVGACGMRRILVIAPGTIGEQLLPPLHHYRNDFPSDASWAGGTKNSQTAQDPDCMQGGVGLEVSVNGVSAQNISQSKEVQSYCISKKGPLNHLLGHEGCSHMEFLKQGHTVNSESIFQH